MVAANLVGFQDLLVIGVVPVFGILCVAVVRLLWKAGTALSRPRTPQRFCPSCGVQLPDK